MENFLNYYFNVQDACNFGLDEAIFLSNLKFWYFLNQTHKRNFRDGRTWTFNSSRAYSELFPFWNSDKIDRLIKSLKKKGIILVGNFNKMSYDKTRWISLSDSYLSLNVSQGMFHHTAKMRNGYRKNAETIPYNKHKYIKEQSSFFDLFNECTLETIDNDKLNPLVQKLLARIEEKELVLILEEIPNSRTYKTFKELNRYLMGIWHKREPIAKTQSVDNDEAVKRLFQEAGL